uniref:Uncharacterized protein n=1 Tax=Denticeps clupeoides TaxID=299321 RepID=A0AAY4AQG3_9TELE
FIASALKKHKKVPMLQRKTKMKRKDRKRLNQASETSPDPGEKWEERKDSKARRLPMEKQLRKKVKLSLPHVNNPLYTWPTGSCHRPIRTLQFPIPDQLLSNCSPWDMVYDVQCNTSNLKLLVTVWFVSSSIVGSCHRPIRTCCF